MMLYQCNIFGHGFGSQKCFGWIRGYMARLPQSIHRKKLTGRAQFIQSLNEPLNVSISNVKDFKFWSWMLKSRNDKRKFEPRASGSETGSVCLDLQLLWPIDQYLSYADVIWSTDSDHEDEIHNRVGLMFRRTSKQRVFFWDHEIRAGPFVITYASSTW